jgi:DMSO/TMAO reductase YedYZ molybdopterin-dependent catalytic subunit
MPAPMPQTSGAMVDRRTVLRAAGFLGLASAVALGVVTVARRGSTAAVDAVRTSLKIPVPTDPAKTLSAGITPDIPGIAPAITPAEDFYQIDVSLTPPSIDVATWALTINGRVDKPITLSYNDLLAMPSIERYVTLTCVSNDVGGDLVGTAKWQGVRLTDLLAKVGVHDDATMVLGRSVDGFTVGFPRAVLDDGRDAMVVYAMNGEPLPVKHGFPVRMVVPGLYGYVSATKWIEQIKLTTPDEDIPFWFSRGWSDDGTIESASRIDVPRDGTPAKAGTVAVGGRAWHQHTGVGSVEVRVDGGAWEKATLADAIGVDTWRLWSWEWPATPGQHTLTVRMHDIDGTPQTEVQRPTFPGASSGLHSIVVNVT